MTQPSTLTITPAISWGKPQEIVQLPSGRAARLKEPDLLDMLAQDGDVRQMFLGFMVAIEKQGPAPTTEAGKEMSMEAVINMMGDFGPFLNLLVRASFVEPQVAERADYARGVIALGDIGLDDKLFVLTRAMAAFQTLKSIVPQPKGAVGAPPNLQSNEHPA
jgi:hypothetical protein